MDAVTAAPSSAALTKRPIGTAAGVADYWPGCLAMAHDNSGKSRRFEWSNWYFESGWIRARLDWSCLLARTAETSAPCCQPANSMANLLASQSVSGGL